MPSNVEYRVVLHRVGKPAGMFEAPGFSVLVQAEDAEDAIRQAEVLARRQNGQFRVVDVHPANGSADPARSE
jgi:hypothetical protein